jgi:hypothetical protein
MTSDFSQPIFRTDEFDTIDETCSGGAYIGGMAAGHEDAGIAEIYLRAAETLVERGLADDRAHEVVLPVLFLYRHALELLLKVAVQPTKLNHDIAALVGDLDALLVTKRGAGLAPGLVARVAEVATFDPRADAFRFTSSANKRSSGAPHFPDEIWVDLRRLRDAMSGIDKELRVATQQLRT